MVTKLKSDTTVSLMFFQHCETSTATWSLLCVYIYFSYIKNSYLWVNKSEVPWNVVIGVMFSTHILKLSTMVVWRIIYNLAVHSYWSLFVLFFFLVGGRDSNFFCYYVTIIYSGYLQSFMSTLMIFSNDESKRRTWFPKTSMEYIGCWLSDNQLCCNGMLSVWGTFLVLCYCL